MPNTNCGDAYQITQPKETIASEGWWKFNAFDTTLYITLTNTDAAQEDLNYEVYASAPCANLGTPLVDDQPDADLSVEVTGLTVGNDYLIKMTNSSGGDIEGLVSVTAQGPIKGELFVRIPA